MVSGLVPGQGDGHTTQDPKRRMVGEHGLIPTRAHRQGDARAPKMTGGPTQEHGFAGLQIGRQQARLGHQTRALGTPARRGRRIEVP